MAKKSNSIDWVAVQKNELEAILNIPEVVSELHDVIMSGEFHDSFDHKIIIGGHKAIGRMRQCERAVSTVLANYQSVDSRTDSVWELIHMAIFNSAKLRFDPLNRYELEIECGFLVTKWAANPRDLQFGEDEALRKLVYVSDGILDMQDLREYIERKSPWILDSFSALDGEHFIEPKQEISDGETVLGSMSPDVKNLFTLIEKNRSFWKAHRFYPGVFNVVSELEDALRECLELAWGKGGTYAVRKGYLVVSLDETVNQTK